MTQRAMTRRAGLRAVAMGLVASLLGGAALAAPCREDTVELRGDFGAVRFSVEVADEPREQARGLMGRRAMPVSSGMLFVYPAPREVNFWMQNTLISLDMLFTDKHGVVTRIHHRAQPLDPTSIPGGDDVLSVLEINGGLAERLGITEGAQLRHPAFAAHDPAWPC